MGLLWTYPNMHIICWHGDRKLTQRAVVIRCAGLSWTAETRSQRAYCDLCWLGSSPPRTDVIHCGGLSVSSAPSHRPCPAPPHSLASGAPSCSQSEQWNLPGILTPSYPPAAHTMVNRLLTVVLRVNIHASQTDSEWLHKTPGYCCYNKISPRIANIHASNHHYPLSTIFCLLF